MTRIPCNGGQLVLDGKQWWFVFDAASHARTQKNLRIRKPGYILPKQFPAAPPTCTRSAPFMATLGGFLDSRQYYCDSGVPLEWNSAWSGLNNWRI